MRPKPRLRAAARASIPVLGVVAGIMIGALVVVAPGRGFLQIVGQLFYDAFGTLDNFASSLVYAIPLGFTGLAIVIAYSAGVFNIGGEGQLQLAAVTTVLVAAVPGFPSPVLHVAACLLGGAATGALWALLPGILRAYKGYSEIVITMLMNYLATLLVSFLVSGPIKDPSGYFPQSRKILATARLAPLVPGTKLHAGIIVFLVLAALTAFLLRRTVFGFRLRSVGFNPEGAMYAGTDVRRTMVVAMLLSGAVAGVAGTVEILGVQSRLLDGFSPGYGFDAIAVALLANLNPLGVILSSFFFGALRNSAAGLQIDMGIPVAFIYIIQGMAIFVVIGASGFPGFLRRACKKARHA